MQNCDEEDSIYFNNHDLVIEIESISLLYSVYHPSFLTNITFTIEHCEYLLPRDLCIKPYNSTVAIQLLPISRVPGKCVNRSRRD